MLNKVISSLNHRVKEVIRNYKIGYNAKKVITAKDLSNITHIEIDGIDYKDYPDFVDAYISNAVWANTMSELTDEQLVQLNSEFSDFVYEKVIDRVF